MRVGVDRAVHLVAQLARRDLRQYDTVELREVEVVAAECRESAFEVRLAPGAGATLNVAMRRYANQPTLAFPWA